jgi:putative holliday junction resolvase
MLPRHTRLAGLDVGSRKIGVALSDTGRRIATPAGVVRKATRFYDTAERLSALWRGEAVSGIVVGLPLNQNGSQGPRAQASRQFAHNLARHFDLPVALWDERFSSVAAERLLLEEADLSRSRRRELVDQTAASFILQGCLDYLIQASQPDDGDDAGDGQDPDPEVNDETGAHDR